MGTNNSKNKEKKEEKQFNPKANVRKIYEPRLDINPANDTSCKPDSPREMKQYKFE